MENSAALRHVRGCHWISAGLGVLLAILTFACAALEGVHTANVFFWVSIPIAAFALGYAAPVRPWRWPIVMACGATLVFWAALIYESSWSSKFLFAPFGPAIVGIITSGVAAALRRSELARA